MAIFEVFLIAVALSADAFAVSVGDGLSIGEVRKRDGLSIAAAFGIFQALMPAIGYFLGLLIADFVQRFDHIIALILLGYIGVKMILEGVSGIRNPQEDKNQFHLTFGSLLIQAVATSIDALVVGVSFSAMGMAMNTMLGNVLFIGAVTFTISIIGVLIGKRFGLLLGKRAEIIGGIILVGIGLKIFIEHVFFNG